MKKTMWVLTVLSLSLALAVSAFAEGGKVRGDNGQGSVNKGSTGQGKTAMPRTGN